MSKNQPTKQRGWKRLEELLEAEEFKKDIEMTRTHNDFLKAVEIPYLISKYKLPTSFHRILANYVENDYLDPLLADDYVRIDTSGEGISLKLSFDINQEQLLKYITTKWTSDIEPVLNGKFGPREQVYAAYYPRRNEEIYLEYKTLKERGKTISYLLTKYGLSKAQIYKIVKRQKSLTNPTIN